MPSVELDLRRIRQRLEREGWVILRQSGGHDVFGHPDRQGAVILPRHRGDLPIGTARMIAKQAGWI